MAHLSSSEHSREQTADPIEKVDSSASALQGTTGEQNLDISELHELHEPPGSCVGYGGGHSRYIEPLNKPLQGHWERRMSGESEVESRYGQDIRASDSSGTVEQHGGSAGYGSVNPNAKPSEAGFNSYSSSGRGGYPEQEDYSLGSTFDDASSKQSGTQSKWGTPDDASGSEVRNGVRHGVTPHGIASGAGVADGFGGSTPTSSDINENRYHRTEVTRSQQQETPYSHALTDSDGPSEGTRDRFEEEGITGNTIGGTSLDQKKKAANGVDHSEGEGFVEKLMHKLPGHGNVKNSTVGRSDVEPVGSDNKLEDEDYEQPGCLTVLKDKLLPNHDKYHDEINSEIYE